MTRQLLKTIGGYAVTYHSEYKTNRFVITQHGKVVERYGDWYSCVLWVAQHTGNFETLA